MQKLEHTVRRDYVIIYAPNFEETLTMYENAFSISHCFIHESGYAEMESFEKQRGFA